ncbi:hypothetical protein EYF80_042950 [Liparis tanakae]|uniref:Uncharacterized protein n=1 Tax=Liparis tanakae TaxID=230148 RepID=A0A4Z2G0R3_9TELE|nr:hypothetical protein EYF80_042950 [Liparis tanakae]
MASRTDPERGTAVSVGLHCPPPASCSPSAHRSLWERPRDPSRGIGNHRGSHPPAPSWPWAKTVGMNLSVGAGERAGGGRASGRASAPAEPAMNERTLPVPAVCKIKEEEDVAAYSGNVPISGVDTRSSVCSWSEFSRIFYVGPDVEEK